MLTFLLLVGTGVFCKLSGVVVTNLGTILPVSLIADICLTAYLISKIGK